MNLLSSATVVLSGLTLAFGVEATGLSVLCLEDGENVCNDIPMSSEKDISLYIAEAEGKVLMTINGIDNALYYFDKDILSFVPVIDDADDFDELFVEDFRAYGVHWDGLVEMPVHETV